MAVDRGELFEDRNLRNRSYVFKDRLEAGRLLTQRLVPSVTPDSLVFAVPAGGVPVALEIPRGLAFPWRDFRSHLPARPSGRLPPERFP